MAEVESTVTTTNKVLNGEGGDPVDIEASFICTVSDSIEECIEWYGDEAKALKSIQADQIRRQMNAVRPILRDAETEMDWSAAAQRAASSYRPGRRGGFGAPEVDATELEEAGSVEAIMELLRAKGVSIT